MSSTDLVEKASTEVNYIVCVKTSNRAGAGTDAKVNVQLYGRFATSDVIELKHSEHLNKFERNQLDTFVIRGQPWLGSLLKIRIAHDNTGVGPSWHLEYVEISDTFAAQKYRFPCHRWLAVDKEDGALARELNCMEISDGQKQVDQSAVGVSRQSLPAHNQEHRTCSSSPHHDPKMPSYGLVKR